MFSLVRTLSSKVVSAFVGCVSLQQVGDGIAAEAAQCSISPCHEVQLRTRCRRFTVAGRFCDRKLEAYLNAMLKRKNRLPDIANASMHRPTGRYYLASAFKASARCRSGR